MAVWSVDEYVKHNEEHEYGGSYTTTNNGNSVVCGKCGQVWRVNQEDRITEQQTEVEYFEQFSGEEVEE